MKNINQSFKENIKEMGRELDSKITYTINDEVIELGNSELNSVTPNFQSSLLKSVMKELDIDSNINIPLGTIVNYKFGVSLNGSEYDYIDFGNYVVYSSEKQEDTNSYKIICYDKMLYFMKDYEDLGVTYPITIRDYVSAICDKIGIDFASNEDEFTNYDKEINNELYLDEEGKSLGYTYRDVLDEIAQVTASIVCLNDNDELEIRYINETNDTINEEYLKDANVNFGELYGPINTVVLSRSAESDNIAKSLPEDLPDDEKIAIKIIDNQIMNWNDRDTYLDPILERLAGLNFYLNDFSSTGICYYDLGDRYNISIGENTYSCVMLNDTINITQGLEENIFTDALEESQTDYKATDTTDKKINRTYLLVNKQEQTISGLIEKTDGLNSQVVQFTADVNGIKSNITNIETSVAETNNKLDNSVNNLNNKIEQETTTRTTEMNEMRTSVSVVTEFKDKVEQDGVEKVNTGTTIVDIDGVHVDNSASDVKSDFGSNGVKVVDKTTNKTQFFSGVVTEDEVEETEELAKYINQAVSYSDNIYVKNFLETPGGRWEPTYRSSEGHGIGFFPVEEE